MTVDLVCSRHSKSMLNNSPPTVYNSSQHPSNSVSDHLISSLYLDQHTISITRDSSELSGFDESVAKQTNIQLLGYNILHKYNIQVGDPSNGGRNIMILEVRTPLFFNAYIIINSPHHYKPNTQLIAPFLDHQYVNDIVQRSSHKASGTAIRDSDRIHCRWENNTIDFKCSDGRNINSIIPVITDTQLLSYPSESLLMLYEHHRCLRSDAVNHCLDNIHNSINKLYILAEMLPDLVNRSDELLYNIKEEVDPLVKQKINGCTIDDRVESIVDYRSSIIAKISRLSQQLSFINNAIESANDLNADL